MLPTKSILTGAKTVGPSLSREKKRPYFKIVSFSSSHVLVKINFIYSFNNPSKWHETTKWMTNWCFSSVATSVKILRPTVLKSSKGCVHTRTSHPLDAGVKLLGGCASWRSKSLEKSNREYSWWCAVRAALLRGRNCCSIQKPRLPNRSYMGPIWIRVDPL